MRKVVLKSTEQVNGSNVDKDKIYIINNSDGIFKAQDTAYKDRFMFIDIGNSAYFWGGPEDSLEELIEREYYDGEEVIEFDVLEEFAEWLVDQV